MGASIGLVMIVKNEESTLGRLAASVGDQIDHFTIVDTGSSDTTMEVARRSFAGVPGEVIADQWRGYGASRNVALEAARLHADWLLLLDADHTLEGELPRDLLSDDLDCVDVEERYDTLRLWRPFLIRAGSGWQWHGRAHEYLSLGERAAASTRSDRFHVVHHGDGGNRPDKFTRERALLEADFADNPDDPRTCFYLARTFDDGGERTQAAEWYRRCLELDDWDEERFYARWRLGVCLLDIGKTEEACGVLFDAWGERPWRAEPLWTLATHYRQQQQWHLCWEVCDLARRSSGVLPLGHGTTAGDDRLFVHSDVYEWRLAYEQSICAYYVAEIPIGRALCRYLLQRVDLPPEIRSSVEANQRFYRP